MTNTHPPEAFAQKLTWAKIQEIRQAKAKGASYGQIEQQFNISRQWAIAIVKERCWKLQAK